MLHWLIFTVCNEFAKVMFLQASVCPQGVGVSASVHPGSTPLPREQTPHSRHSQRADPPGSRHPSRSRHPPGTDTPSPQEQTPPWEQTPPGADTPLGTDTPQSRHPPGSRPPPDTATAADGTHPTGMHSCLVIHVLYSLNKTLTVIRIVQTLHTSVNILHLCIHKNVRTMFQQKLDLSVNSEEIKFQCHP